MNAKELKIKGLADFAPSSAAEWVERVKAEPADVVAGAIYSWQGGGGVSAGPDPKAARREAARAIIETRLTEQLEKSAARLQLIGIGVALAGVFVAVVQIYRA